MIKKTYKVQGMDCTACALVVEADLEDAGIKSSCNYARATLDVEFDDGKVTEDKIHKIVSQSGYRLAE